jgi:membrane associated rhomboid family serine protease
VSETAPVDSRRATPETIAALHAAEVRKAWTKAWSRAALLVAALGLWAVIDHARPGSFTFLLVGVALLFAGSAALDWWRKRGVDPLAVALDEAALARHLAEREAAERHRAHLASSRPWVTYGLIACLAVIAFLQFASREGILGSIAAAGLVKDAVRRGEWWRLLTATYLHGSAWHLWANLGALSALGRVFEAYTARARLALVYLAAAIGGSVVSLVLLPHTNSIGASGAIMGVAGFLLVLAWRRPHEVPPWLLRGALLTFGLTAYIGFFGFAFIDNAAHAGGAVAGMVVGLATIRGQKAGQDASSRFRFIDVMSAVAAVVIVAGAALTARALVRPGANQPVVPAGADRVTPITTVALRQATGVPVTSVEIENRGDIALEAWIVSLYGPADARRPIASELIDFCCSESAQSTPLQPQEKRQIPLSSSLLSRAPRPPASTILRLAVVLFSDLSFEGSQAARDAILRRRTEQADDLAYWIDTLTRALAQPGPSVRSFLSARIDSRAREARAAHRALDASAVGAVAERAERTPDRFADDAGGTIARMTRERFMLLAHVKR